MTTPDDSGYLESMVDDFNTNNPVPLPHRPITVQRHSRKRDWATYGGLFIGFVTMLGTLMYGYAGLCNDVANNRMAMDEVKVMQKDHSKEIGANAQQIANINVTVQRIDTSQQEQKVNLKTRMDRQDVVLDRILNKIE